MNRSDSGKRATAAGILLGVGLGGFVDGILLHQILQWHNMLSSVVPPDTLDAMRLNMLWDGLFHAATWIITLLGVVLLWSAVRDRNPVPSAPAFAGLLLMGWGLFNLAEGIIDHHLLGIHHVKEVPDPLMWDIGFLAIGGVLFTVIGWMLARAGKRRSA